MDDFFCNLKHRGTLHREHCFLEFEGEPILFICRDDRNDRYLCLCTEFRSELRWTVAPVTEKNLWRAMDHEIDLASLFKLDPFVFLVEKEASGEYRDRRIPRENLDPLDLPADGVFLDCGEKARMLYHNIMTPHKSLHKTEPTILSLA